MLFLIFTEFTEYSRHAYTANLFLSLEKCGYGRDRIKLFYALGQIFPKNMIKMLH